MELELKKGLAVYWHRNCALHDIDDHIEQPSRVLETINYLKERFKSDDNIIFVDDYNLAEDSHLQLYHTNDTINIFMEKCTIAEATNTIHYIDMDTPIMQHTRKAVLAAVGSVVRAVDDLYHNNIASGFCCIRPPGHHAEPNRACGFCYFNNIAIAAKYAQSRYNVKKVAILDFDVHHGNGTEAGFENDETVFYGSIHELHSFPNTGVDQSPFIQERAKDPKYRRIVNRAIQSGPLSRQQFRECWKHILDEMLLFQPELILISAGFDAHDEDPLSDVELIEDDYAYITKEILLCAYKINKQSSSSSNNGNIKVLSMLEGGYDIPALQSSIYTHVHTLAQHIITENYASIEQEYQQYLLEQYVSREQGSKESVTVKELDAMDDDDEFINTHNFHHKGDEIAALKDFMKGLDL